MLELQRGNLPPTFAIPAGVGDVLVGVTAPIVALLLRRGGPIIWAIAITWNVLGIIDLIYAVTLGLLAQAQFVLTSYLRIIPQFFVPMFAIVHIATVLLLVRKEVRSLLIRDR